MALALNHLESHVIVGLQNNVQESLQRWINITLETCSEHPEYSKMKNILTKSIESRGEKRSEVSVRVKDSAVLSNPDVTQFDEDLQDLIRAYTEEDEVIYKRATELYEEQRHW
eukprot:CAMPEP_0201930168 /NCGR_PEP_ID=MMETSP0903-20130614/24608_1 /ASSEMBLY_ACC=CAM_ASM_000552 /TAXON_ID=420261 /ORGANISM="Thalassiosira antarctica, Strain CCMP982" /LENGTH=112 /DNA_ID=CAMNT_0048469169 /DNA_START=13 /DNA_END=348 /DNA_ORIENTATION=-